MKCRMCSRPLTGAGRLCRECEHEVARERQDPPADDGTEALVPDARLAEVPPRRPRLRARSIVALAFCAGVLGVAGLRFALADLHRTPARSIMLDAAWSPHAGSASREPQRAAVTPR
jgi:hypothetical protein